VRKVVVGAALAAILVLASAGTAWAGSRAQYCPPNEVRLAKALMTSGIIPRGATKAQITDALQRVMQARLKSEDHTYNYSFSFVSPLDRGLTSWGRVIKSDIQASKKAKTVTEKVLVILVDFSENPANAWNGKVGPLHGKIPPPARYDNSTYWPGDFSPRHYQDMLFGRSYKIFNAKGKLRGTTNATMRNYYLEQSAKKFTVAGDIANWVTVPHPEAYYGADSVPFVSTDDANGAVWRLVEDAVSALAQKDPHFPWAEYDQKNPYGIAGEDPNVPDGYIDHLVVIHAGMGEEAGGGAQGADAIWSHSFWVDSTNGLGPHGAGLGGFRIPGTAGQGTWVGAYTMNPEDGAAGVFCHEFGHDLGLPDEYDTTYDGESPMGFWSLMDSGSWGGARYGIGYRPGGMNAWDKLALGWLDPIVVKNGQHKRVTLQGAALGDRKKAAVEIPAPDSLHTIALSSDGVHAWWSQMGNDLVHRLTVNAPVAVPSGSPSLTLSTWYEIESGFDYAFVEVSTDNGATWRNVRGDKTVETTPGSGVWGLTGVSGGGAAPAWVTVTYDMTAYAGQSVLFRLRYKTDPGVALRGWEVR
jgi:immune inhibitor A